MAPEYRTDVARERWEQEEWRHYELWEKVEAVRHRFRIWLVTVVVAIALILSAIPVLMDRGPRWRGSILARQIAEEVSHLKVRAALEQKSYRFSLMAGDNLGYRVEEVSTCSSSERVSDEVHWFGSPYLSKEYTYLDGSAQIELGIPAITQTICVDYLEGIQLQEQALVAAFGIVPVKDLAEKRIDRVSLVTIQKETGLIRFD